MRILLAKLTLTLGATVATLFVAEIAVRIIEAIRPNSRIEFLTRHDPVLGWSKSPNSTAVIETAEFEVTEQTNSRGLRGPDIPFDKPDGTLRVLLLGDSFLEGYSVNDADLVSEVVRRELQSQVKRPVEVINGGTVGYSTDQELLFYQNEGRRYSPDLTVLLFYVNDVWFNRQDRYWRGRKPYFELRGDNLTLENTPVPPPDPEGFAYAVQEGKGLTGAVRRSDAFLGRQSVLYRTAREVVSESPSVRGFLTRAGLVPVPGEWMPWRRQSTPELSAAWQATEAILRRLRDTVEADQSAFAAFYIPSRPAVYPADWERTKLAYAMDDAGWDPSHDAVVLRQICERQGFECQIAIDEFRAEARRLKDSGQSLYFWQDAHWSPEGHQLAGELIAQMATGLLEQSEARAAPR